MGSGLNFLQSHERFIPVGLGAMCAKMLEDPRLTAAERTQLQEFFAMAAARFHFEFHRGLQELKAAYAPFDPDREVPCPTATIADNRHGLLAPLAEAFQRLLVDANYVEMQPVEIRACLEYDSFKGLVIRASLADYAVLNVFYRGVRREQRRVFHWYAPWRSSGETIHVLSRVALLVQRANSQDSTVLLKLFKDVVAEDLEMVLPDVRVCMRLLDHLKIGSSLAGGAATAIWKAFTAAALSPWVFLTVLSGFAGALVRSTLGFLSHRSRYMQALTTRLYFQQLASNSSMLGHVVDAAEEEECKELLLAYYLLYTERGCDLTTAALDHRIESWLQTTFGVTADFEIDHAVDKLAEKGLLARHSASDTGNATATEILKVLDLPAALRRLDETWDQYFGHHQASAGQDRLADGCWPKSVADRGNRRAA